MGRRRLLPNAGTPYKSVTRPSSRGKGRQRQTSLVPNRAERVGRYVQRCSGRGGYNAPLSWEAALGFLLETAMGAHNMPESAKALWRIVSLTAAKTRRIFEVSVACVRLDNRHVSSNLPILIIMLFQKQRLQTLNSKQSVSTARKRSMHAGTSATSRLQTRQIEYHLLRIQVQMRPVNLIKPP